MLTLSGGIHLNSSQAFGKQISSQSLQEGCTPWTVTLRIFFEIFIRIDTLVRAYS